MLDLLARSLAWGRLGRGVVVGSETFTFLIIVALVVVVAYWCAIIAQRKDYPTWFGVVMGLFLGLIGLLIVALLPSRRRTGNI